MLVPTVIQYIIFRKLKKSKYRRIYDELLEDLEFDRENIMKGLKDLTTEDLDRIRKEYEYRTRGRSLDKDLGK